MRSMALAEIVAARYIRTVKTDVAHLPAKLEARDGMQLVIITHQARLLDM
jgi:DNA-binding NarL/FixJ family response regulator